jgi:molybdopterin-synthase adenylyltransferase
MNQRLVSQSVLGADTDAVLADIEVGIVGLGGGGSHVAQQLAHVGVGKFVPVDDDIIEEKI